jgi:hypothetical protein
MRQPRFVFACCGRGKKRERKKVFSFAMLRKDQAGTKRGNNSSRPHPSPAGSGVSKKMQTKKNYALKS